MMRWFAFLFWVLLPLSACSGQEFYLPEGDVQAGEAVFKDLQCYGCHEVRGGAYPSPTAITPTFVTLGQGEHSREYLVESIIAPSHRFATPEPPPGQTANDENIASGSRSRMSDFSDLMTVKQLLDLVAYLEHLENGSSQDTAMLR